MRLALCCLALAASPAGGPAAAADPEPLRFTHTIEMEDIRVTVPMELYLTADGPARIEAKIAGNPRSLQRQLPAMLSDVIEDTCQRRIVFQVDEGHAEGDRLRLKGRVQIQLYACGRATRTRILSNITAIDLLLDSRIADDCVEARLEELTLAPGGLIGGLLNLTRLTGRSAPASGTTSMPR